MPGQGSTYLDQLVILNEQDFLGGAAKYGKAVKEGKQNQTLVDLWNKFNADKNELQTTLGQQGDFNKHLSTVDMEDGEKGPPEVGAYVDFMKSVDEMGAYAGLYQPFITAFATLGDDGVKIASTLSNELATKMQLAEKKGEVPLRDLEYKTLAQDFFVTREKHQAWAKDEVLKRDSMEAADYILNSPTFDLMEGGDITTASSQRLKKHNVAIKTIVDDAFEHFGGKISKGAITAGLQTAMGFSGKSFAFNDLALLSKQLGTGITEMELQSYASLLRGWSAKWMNMNPQLRQAVKNYMQDGTLPNEEMVKAGQEPAIDKIKELAKIYDSEGDYMNFYSLLGSNIPGFTDLKEVPTGETFEPPFKQPMITLPTLEGTEDIIRPFGPSGFMKGDYNYNPHSIIQLQERLRSEKDEITGGILFKGVYDEPSSIEQWYKRESESIMSPFEEAWGIFKGSVTEDVEKFNKSLK